MHDNAVSSRHNRYNIHFNNNIHHGPVNNIYDFNHCTTNNSYTGDNESACNYHRKKENHDHDTGASDAAHWNATRTSEPSRRGAG